MPLIAKQDGAKLHPGVSGAVKPKRKHPGRPKYGWWKLAAELHRLYAESVNPNNPIVLPGNAAGAAEHLAAWLKQEWAAGHRPDWATKEPLCTPKAVGDRIRRRHTSTSKRDHGRFIGGGAQAYCMYYQRMMAEREANEAARQGTPAAA